MIRSPLNIQSLHGSASLDSFKSQWCGLADFSYSPFSAIFFYQALCASYGLSPCPLVATREGHVCSICPGVLHPVKKLFTMQAYVIPPLHGYLPVSTFFTSQLDSLFLQEHVRYLFDQLGVDLFVLTDVEEGSNLDQLITGSVSRHFVPYREHCRINYGMDLSIGVEAFVRGRSKNLQKVIRKIENKAAEKGLLELSIYRCGEHDFSKGVERMVRIDQCSWQGRRGVGVVNNSQDAAFFEALSYPGVGSFCYEVFILSLNEQDIAFSIVVRKGEYAYALKQGYDPAYSEVRPGNLLRIRTVDFLCAQGVKYFDNGTTLSGDKREWCNVEKKHASWWLLNPRSLKGRCLATILKFAGKLKV